MNPAFRLGRVLVVLLVVAAAVVAWRAWKGETPAETLEVIRQSVAATAAEDDLIETVDVGVAVDSRIDLETDSQAEARREGFVGVLPGDFPRDVYIYEPSILLDFGNDPGQRFISLRIRRPAGEVATTYAHRLAGDGWSGPELGADAVILRKGEREIRVGIDVQNSETVVRIDY